MNCAIATDDGIFLMGRHFGDACQYDLYCVEKDGFTYSETIKNPFREKEEDDEDVHGDKIKASNMKELLLEKSVSVIVSKRFGPNINRMVRNLVPVIVRHNEVEKAKHLLLEHYDEVQAMIHEGENRQHIVLG